MIVLGIDPGPVTSGVIVYDSANDAAPVLHVNKAATEADIRRLYSAWAEHAHVVIEKPVFMGFNPRRMGQSIARTQKVLETAWVAGRFSADAEAFCGADKVHTMTRQGVLTALGIKGRGDADSRVRAACIADHGGELAVGKKKAPGPLYGVTSHAWQALGLVLAWLETRGGEG